MPKQKDTSKLKTQPNRASVLAFLKKAAAGPRLADAKTIRRMMETATGTKGIMWGSAIVGFDTCMIRYADGREAPWPLIAFSPRKSEFVLYVGWRKHPELTKKIGKHKTAGGCLYIKKLADCDTAALQRLITAAAKTKRGAYP